MSSTWIVRDPVSAEAPSWSVRVAGEGDQVTTYTRLSAHEAKLALYRVMLGLPPVDAGRQLSSVAPVASVGYEQDAFADAA